ncbi:MAG: lipocalin family protein [Flavobacteriales bacterium]|nr:lipocalin family protein [Flavobacteriales bacterium]
MKISACVTILFFVAIMPTTAQVVETVAHVDIDKYTGRWYEIAAYPQRFQKGCHCTTADYTANEKGHLIVENTCNRDSVGGKQSSIKGKAIVMENSGNAKLKVRFFWPFSGKYWIVDLADDYSYAVVSHPNKKSLWILSRTPKMEESVYREILARLRDKGYDLTKLYVTKQG